MAQYPGCWPKRLAWHSPCVHTRRAKWKKKTLEALFQAHGTQWPVDAEPFVRHRLSAVWCGGETGKPVVGSARAGYTLPPNDAAFQGSQLREGQGANRRRPWLGRPEPSARAIGPVGAERLSGSLDGWKPPMGSRSRLGGPPLRASICSIGECTVEMLDSSNRLFRGLDRSFAVVFAPCSHCAGFFLERGALSGRQRQQVNIQVIAFSCVTRSNLQQVEEVHFGKEMRWRKDCGGGAHRLLVGGFDDDMPLRK